ncbi:hypothetical protein HanRHA438_Chr09g0409501 [Helianthus annuus]|nr:hypothetical protein HanIR_Chr09g0428651 [Helianthus annuus]KAJ0889125.1 hypothetical protein HanRHA438_Chr09g0409501 [Helianthus annuus]
MTNRLVRSIREADAVICTLPEKLPEGPLGEVELLDAALFLQVPKGAPACKNKNKKRIHKIEILIRLLYK